jgi:hypothetical protein
MFFGLSITTCQAQTEKAKTAFVKMFPEAQNVKWGRENAHEFEAEFKLNDKSISTNFSDTGEWLETESEINSADLPQAVKTYIAANEKDAAIKAAFKIENSKNETKFEVEIKKAALKKELVFNEQGEKI